ncbi:MAG: hypothetical protein HYS37_08340 [Candidatus Rokubacteria bacterium]|nr:hypothetical protein [Candidatus Rokubacteria bacterium]
MRVMAFVLAFASAALAATPAAAQEAEALRRELEQMRRQFETAQQEYQKALQALTERLQRLEARPPAAAAQPATVQAPPPSQPTLADYARPREPFALGARRGPGQLLFDMGIVGDFTGNLTQRNVEKADRGTFAGRENRLFPREVEVNLFGRVDPYAEGHVRFEFAEEFEDGQRATQAKLAEAYITLLTLPFGTRLTLGQVPVRFGLLSHLHREALPQPDPPQVLLRFLGEEQFRESGAELSWVLPTPFYVEALAGAFDGDNEAAFGRGSLRSPLLFGRLRTFVELGESGALHVGVSGARGETGDRLRSILAGIDLKYKHTPDGWRHPLLTLGGEALYSVRDALVADEATFAGDTRTRRRLGWYAWAEIQPWKRWAGGVRYDSTQFPVDPGREWAVEPYASFMPSEFLRFRLAYKHTERSHRDGFNVNDSSARIVDELLLQATFFLGAHVAHPF